MLGECLAVLDDGCGDKDDDEFGHKHEDANAKEPSSEMIRQMTKTRRLDFEDDENTLD